MFALTEGVDISAYAKSDVSPEMMFDRRKSQRLQKNS